MRSLIKNKKQIESSSEKIEIQIHQETPEESNLPVNNQSASSNKKSESETNQIESDSSRVDLKLVYDQRLESFLKTDESNKNNQEIEITNEKLEEEEEEENNEDIALENNQDYYNLVAKEKAKSGEDIYDLSEEEEDEEYESEEVCINMIHSIKPCLNHVNKHS